MWTAHKSCTSSTLRTWHARSVASWVALCLAACGGAAALVIPLFEFGFSGTSNGVSIALTPLPGRPTQSSGSFDSVSMTVNDAVTVGFTGTYSGCTFKLTVIPPVPPDTVPPPIADSYDGRFTGRDSIELQPTSGVNLPKLTLQRKHPVGTDPTPDFGC